MAVIVVVSAEARVGRSLLAAALAYRMARAGTPVTIARLAGDDGAAADAAAFASVDELASPGREIALDDLVALASVGDVVVEASAGPPPAMPGIADVRVLGVANAQSSMQAFEGASYLGTVVTNVPSAEVAAVASRQGVVAVLPEDRVLAAPSVEELASACEAEWLVRPRGRNSVGRVMIGTISSDAASPYFGNRERTCIVTRYDKTDVQLAALGTDIEVLVLTGGGEPSPYLLDRVSNGREDVSVLLAQRSTVDVMRAIETTYGRGRFDGMAKLERAVEMLDAAQFTVGSSQLAVGG